MRSLWLILRHLVILLLLKLPLQILGLVILAPLLLFVPRDKEQLPKYFKWFDNNESWNNVFNPDGLSGGKFYRAEWKDPTGWLARYHWLAIRNPVNYFQHNVLGAKLELDTPLKSTEVTGEPNFLYLEKLGYCTIYATLEDGKCLWEHSSHIYLGFGFVLRTRVGYKLNHRPLHLELPARRRTLQWVFSIGLRRGLVGVKT